MRIATMLVLSLAPTLAAAAATMSAPASAQVCGHCHRAIQQAWETSAHADAMHSRVFQDALEEVKDDFGPTARRVCLGCHAPLAVLMKDVELVRATSWEGVTCDYCHSIRSVRETGGTFEVSVQLSNLKSGPSRDSVSPAHQTAYSDVHTKALACAGCHEYKNALGFPVVTTYSEWREGPSGRAGVACQRCHMDLVKGNVVDPRVLREASHQVNLHEMPGSHSISQLDKAVIAKLAADRSGDTVKVRVTLTNAGVGHFVPTGSPMRQIILDVKATPAGGDPQIQHRVLTRTLADATGAAIKKEYVAFLKAAKVLSDTRLAPGETRTESFTFQVPSRTPTHVEASLTYFHPATSDPEETKRIKFLSMTRELR